MGLLNFDLHGVEAASFGPDGVDILADRQRKCKGVIKAASSQSTGIGSVAANSLNGNRTSVGGAGGLNDFGYCSIYRGIGLLNLNLQCVEAASFVPDGV